MAIRTAWFRIPSSDLESLSKLAALPEASVEELLAALAMQQPPLSGHKLAEQIASDVPSVILSDLAPLVDIILTLLAVRARIDQGTDEFAELVVANEQL